MDRRKHRAAVGLLVALLVLAGGPGMPAAQVGAAASEDVAEEPRFEVWLIDQQDSRPTAGGTLHIFDGRALMDGGATARPEVIDLGGPTHDLCLARTGSAPRRPHMLVFNGGDDELPAGNTHAVLAFVATGHVVFFDAASRRPLECIDVGAQAHAAWPTPDRRHVLVANQNGKLLQRIGTDYANNRFALDNAATLDLAACTTPSGAPCQDPVLRPDNAPICQRTDRQGRFTFVTLRGGGLFVVDHARTPMQIVAEYDRGAIADNGCGVIEANGKMYVNSGAGLPGNSHGHDVYAIGLSELGPTPLPPNTPAARLVYRRAGEGEVDAHGVALSRGRYLWVGDRVKNDVTVVDTETDRVVNRLSLVGPASDDPAPDLLDPAPSGNRMFASLRGPNPATGGHDAIGSTPGLGVIQVTEDGRGGRLLGIVRVPGVLGPPDPHAVNVRPLVSGG